jgi:hypothetical protein
MPWDWTTAQRVLLFISAALYAASFAALLLSRGKRSYVELFPFRRLLLFGLLSHVAFALFRAWCVGRLPFGDRTELLSWFAMSCVIICLAGTSWLRSRMVIGSGVLCAFVVTVALGIWYDPRALPYVDVLRGPLTTWYGFATPLAYAAGFLAFAAQFRAVLASARRTSLVDNDFFQVSENSMNALSGALTRLCYPLLLSGLLAFSLGCLDAVSLGWFWQRSTAAQLFILACYSVYLHLGVSKPTFRGRLLLAQFAAFSGIVVSVLSFDAPHGLLRGVGLGILL